MILYNKIRFVVIAYFLFFAILGYSKEYRNSGFIKPMNLPFNLAGSFGEPRKDHFHSGIDIKTNGIEGEPVFAIGDGYISRIRVSPYGYGRAIYITHTNGFVSVYGHLSKFYGKIEKYIHAQHYAQQKSELDIYLDSNKFPLKQGDTIAFSGNTGGSSAPHLHFEIRDSKTEHALNPLDFYPRDFYVDTIPPQINKVKVNIFDIYYNSFSTIYNLKNEKNYFTNTDSIIILNDSLISFSLEGFDKQDNSENKNGIRIIEVFQENNLVFKYNLTEIDFDKTRMCNAFVDYDEMMNDNGYFYNCNILKNNNLNFYPFQKSFYELKNGSNNFKIFCLDDNNNKTEIKLNIYRKNLENKTSSSSISAVSFAAMSVVSNISIKKINCSFFDSISDKKFKISFTKNTFYDNVDIYLRFYINPTKNSFSNFYTISDVSKISPLQKPAKISFNSTIQKDRNKIVIVRQDNKEKETALKTTFDKTTFYADTKELGTFYLKYDTTKPTIEILNFKLEILNENKFIQVRILDELSGIDSYNAYIDDKWVNFYYDAKNDLIQYQFDEYCSKGEHTLKIIVNDNVGNKSIIQQNFIY